MKVALVCPYDLGVPGGVQSHVLQLATELRRLGDEVVVVAPDDRRSGPHAPGDDRGTYRATGPSIRVPFNGSVAPIGAFVGGGRRPRAHLRDIAPDVVHVHEPLVPAVGLAAVTSRVAPVVATFHAWSDDVRAYALARPLGRHVLGRLAATLAVSSAAATYHGRALGVAADRFHVIPNGVDVRRFADVAPDPTVTASRDDPANGTQTLLFVGRLEARKGLATLVQAFALLHVRRPGLRLLVVGEGPEHERCRALLPAGIGSRVRFLGRVDDDDLVRRYAEADVYVSPAIGGESFGIVLLESMAAGRPVIASDIPGYRGVVRDGTDGLLVPPGDPQALADAIDGLLDDPARRASLVRAGRATAAAHDWPLVAARVREVYAHLRPTGA